MLAKQGWHTVAPSRFCGFWSENERHNWKEQENIERQLEGDAKTIHFPRER